MKDHHSIFLKLGLILLANVCWQTGYSQIPGDELSAIITSLEGEDYQARYEARMALQDSVSDATAPGNRSQRIALEKQLISVLDDELLPTTRLWILRQLDTIGSDASIEALAGLLNDSNADVADAARMALVANPSSKATRALIDGLENATEDSKALGFISALGDRKSRRAVKAIAPFLSSENLDVVQEAIMALGEIGGRSSRDALNAFYPSAHSRVKGSVELALLETSNDLDLCTRMISEGSDRSVQASALQRGASLNANRSAEALQGALEAGTALDNASLIRVAMLSSSSALRDVALSSVEELSLADQAVVVGALANGEPGSNEDVTASLAQSQNEPLKIQAVEALGRIGSVTSLPILLEALNSRSRDLRETAAYALASLPDARVDRELMAAAQSGSVEERANALAALSHRNSSGVAALVNELVQNDGDDAIREAALEAMERIGDAASFEVLVDLIVSNASGLRRDAQRTLKRMSLRIGDPETAWEAFNVGFQKASGDPDAKKALLVVIDSAPTKATIEYLKETWMKEDEASRKIILRTLPVWRNWDGGFLLLDIANFQDSSDAIKDSCYDGVSRLILSNPPSLNRKFELARMALQTATTDKRRDAILKGFRNSGGPERRYVNNNDVDPILKETVLAEAN